MTRTDQTFISPSAEVLRRRWNEISTAWQSFHQLLTEPGEIPDQTQLAKRRSRLQDDVINPLRAFSELISNVQVTNDIFNHLTLIEVDYLLQVALRIDSSLQMALYGRVVDTIDTTARPGQPHGVRSSVDKERRELGQLQLAWKKFQQYVHARRRPLKKSDIRYMRNRAENDFAKPLLELRNRLLPQEKVSLIRDVDFFKMRVDGFVAAMNNKTKRK